MQTNRLKRLFTITGLMAVALLFWTVLAFLMDFSSFRLSLICTLGGILLFLATGILKNRTEHRNFQKFLDSQRKDKAIQEKLKNERIGPVNKSGRAKVKAVYKERNMGLNWTGASVHGAVPHRKKRRSFLPKNR
jgi:hypothetical protein